MKKLLSVILLISIFALPVYANDFSTLTVSTTYAESTIESGIYTDGGRTYLDILSVSEALGSVVFECAEEKSYFIISRDGDVINHTAGTDFFELNGEIFSLDSPSFSDSSGKTYVPCLLFEKAFCVSLQGFKISREMGSNYYNSLISNLLKFCLCGDFYPENFSRYYAFYCANPTMDPGVVINSVNIGLDKTPFDHTTVSKNPDSTLVLVNKLNRLPDDYSYPDLVSIDRKYTAADGRNYLMTSEAYDNYIRMYDAAANEGLKLRIVSSHRTFEYQKNLYNSYLRQYGFNYAERYSARAGYSEHHTGLAVDINSVYTTFENSREYKWLKDNAHKFGFIERYKKGREYITGYSYEPWHYRYVGEEAATIIYEQDITFEEYYSVYIYKSKYSLDKDRVWANVLQKYYK